MAAASSLNINRGLKIVILTDFTPQITIFKPQTPLLTLFKQKNNDNWMFFLIFAAEKPLDK